MTQADDPTPKLLPGAFQGRIHRLPVRIYYEDTDFTGLVYHGAYVRFLERGRSDFLRAAGIGHRALLERPDPCAFVVTRLGLSFRRPARIDDILWVDTAYDVLRGPRLIISQTIYCGGETLVEAEVEAACITLAGRARRPPADLVGALAPFFLYSPP